MFNSEGNDNDNGNDNGNHQIQIAVSIVNTCNIIEESMTNYK